MYIHVGGSYTIQQLLITRIWVKNNTEAPNVSDHRILPNTVNQNKWEEERPQEIRSLN